MSHGVAIGLELVKSPVSSSLSIVCIRLVATDLQVLPLKQHMSNAGTYPNEINRIHDMRYKKGMIDSAEDAW